MNKHLSTSIASVLACLGFELLAISAEAQTLEAIYSFTNPGNPQGGNLIVGPDGNLYATTQLGGTNSGGTVFAATTSGEFTVLANFGGIRAGLWPRGGVTLGPDWNLYGTTSAGGTNTTGTVFRLTTNGVLTTLYSFSGANGTNADGVGPYATVTAGLDGNLYGTTQLGGVNGSGTVFKMTMNGVLTSLFSFDPVVDTSSGTTNATGAGPKGGLTWGLDGNLYGTTSGGGSAAGGTVFRVTTNGVFKVLVNFVGTNGDDPEATMALGPDGCLYGTTRVGGSLMGTVFKVTTNGVLTTLVNFTLQTGTRPESGVTFGPDGNLYGTTSFGTFNGTQRGTVFRLTTNGVLITLASFAQTNGSQPRTGVTFGPDGNLYGTTFSGGLNGNGVIYRLKLRPTLSIGRGADGAVTLNVTSTPGSTNLLWATTDMSLPMANWTVLATNVVTNVFFQFTDTNTSGAQAKFYRVSAP